MLKYKLKKRKNYYKLIKKKNVLKTKNEKLKKRQRDKLIMWFNVNKWLLRSNKKLKIQIFNLLLKNKKEK